MKKNKLESSYDFDFYLIGIVCNKKEYKLAWHLNESLGISLEKQKDIRIEFANNTSILISNFLYESEFVQIELLQNKLVAGGLKNQLLLPEAKQFDFFFKFKDDTDELTFENVSVIIRDIPIIEYTMKLNFDHLKSKENLLY
ncbi:MAG: IPExxxVDY family protein [Ekhidna sp.]